ncbi:response regulator [Candidatus Bathyarchaeota archaeon]|nr:response regulator [Candidatus Bathyarchaeota archaeon]
MVTESSVHRLKARIRVVDREPQSAETLRDILVTKGFDVETAENGIQAIDLHRSVQHFDLLITEMKLPEVDGLELLRMIRQLKRDLPVRILTGDGTVENGIHSIEEGACDYVL